MRELSKIDNKILSHLNTLKEWTHCDEISEVINEGKNDVYHSLDKLRKKGFIKKDSKPQGFHNKPYVFFLLNFEKYATYLEELSELRTADEIPKNERKILVDNILDVIKESILNSRQDFCEFQDVIGQSLRDKEREVKFVDLIDIYFQVFLNRERIRISNQDIQ